ncbi:MAG: hypothetical protein U0638_08785 [Phycisphaerales bacterium]
MSTRFERRAKFARFGTLGVALAVFIVGVASCWCNLRAYVQILPGWYIGVDTIGTQITLLLRTTPPKARVESLGRFVNVGYDRWSRARVDWRWMPEVLSRRPAWGVTLPSWAPALAFGIIVLIVRRELSHPRRDGCPACGYPRLGLASDAPCPECGSLPTPGAPR